MKKNIKNNNLKKKNNEKMRENEKKYIEDINLLKKKINQYFINY